MIKLTTQAFFKLRYFTLEAKDEISGLGKSRFEEDGKDILITDIKILPQISSRGSTELNEESMAKFLNDLIEKGEDPAKWNVWWHSHGDIGVFWSQTDETTIETTTGGDYLISLVVNKKLQMLSRLDIFKPFRFTVEDELRHLSFKGRNKKFKSYCQNKIKKCVKEPKIPKWWKKESKKTDWGFLGGWWNNQSPLEDYIEKFYKKGSKGKQKSLTLKNRKKKSRSSARVTLADKQRGVWRKWG